MKDRAKSFKTLAISFERRFENFLFSASKLSFPVPVTSSHRSLAEIDFMRRFQPKLSGNRRSSPDFSRRVLKKWSPRAKIRIDLSAIKKGIVSEVDFDDREGYVIGYWEPIRAFKSRLRELEKKCSSSEIIERLKNSKFMVKVKSSHQGGIRSCDDSGDIALE